MIFTVYTAGSSIFRFIVDVSTENNPTNHERLESRFADFIELDSTHGADRDA